MLLRLFIVTLRCVTLCCVTLCCVTQCCVNCAVAAEPLEFNVVAHRGLLRHTPENTLSSFRTCLDLRIGFEVDVRRSADGTLVCIHDDTVDRTTNGQGRVDSLTSAALQDLDAGSWFDPRFAGERVPTFAEVLQLIKTAPDSGSATIAIDLKASDIEQDVVEAAVNVGVLHRLLFIGSAIRNAEVRQSLRAADAACHVACLANTPPELEQALADSASDWVYFRYLPSREEIGRVRQQGKQAILAGPTVAGLERTNWRRALYVGINRILTDYAVELADLRRLTERRALETKASAVPHNTVLSYGEPSEVEVDQDRLSDAVSLMERSIEDDELRGAVLLVARRGKIILHTALGWADEDRVQPMRKDSLFRMASNSKAVTAVGILKLVEDGLLGLDDPVADHLPAFATPAASQITIRQLLTHTSGMRIKSLFLSPLMQSSEQHPEAPTLLLEVARFGEIGAQVKPGTTYQYNNAGYNTLAGLTEALTGSYADHLQATLYQPLGMHDSCNHESVADHSRMSTVLRRSTDGNWQARWRPGDEPDFPFPRGSGGMISSAYDYAVFCQMMLNGGVYGDHRVLPAKLVREATNPQIGHIAAAEKYGLGWSVSQDGGAFSHSGSDGTWAWVDPERELIGLVLTQTQTRGNTTPRLTFWHLVNLACTDLPAEAAASPLTKTDGFYKDIFMSSGSNLTSRKQLFAAESLGLSYEYYAGSDTYRQNRLLIGSKDDENGILLYPDGQPRYRLIYVNGGAATLHGKSLTSAGRQRLRSFNANGGSYCGSCAGSFLSGRNVDQRSEPREGYLHIFPYNTLNTGLKKGRVGHKLPEASPLLAYRQFGADRLVEDIYHNNGNWLSTREGKHLSDTEVLATYECPEQKMHGEAAIWAYRANEQMGRIVNIGSHPEGVEQGERLALTESCLLYSLDGTGKPRIKGTLVAGSTRVMDRKTSDNSPDYTRIGDRQFHHFRFEVTDDSRVNQLTLTTDSSANLNLYLRPGAPAFSNNAEHHSCERGGNESLRVTLKPGTWFASVECATTVKQVEDADSGFYRYYGDTEVLNGVSYTIELQQTAK